MSNNFKRKLTKFEIQGIRDWMEGASQNNKPSIRTIAKRLGGNRPAVIKALGGWKGIQRNRPQVEKRQRVIDRNISSPVQIEPFTTDVLNDLKT